MITDKEEGIGRQLTIDEEFRELIPPMSVGEYTGLAHDIIDKGCLDAIKVWKGIIIDGHNRYDICQKNNIPFDTIEMAFRDRLEAEIWILCNQKNRRNLSTYQRAEIAKKIEVRLAAQAKKRQQEHGGTAPGKAKTLFSSQEKSVEPIHAEKQAAQAMGISEDTLYKSKQIDESGDKELIEEIKTGKKSISAGYREVQEKKKAQTVSTFNATNEKIDWAKWSWNPYTGCLHGCSYCYARDIANRFYPEKFKPTFRPERLEAPFNTVIPDRRKDESGIHNVFVCSMADLFGEWVEQEHIDQILDVVRKASQWNFIFLTKNPSRMMDIDWPVNAWIGATVDTQARLEDALASFDYLACEGSTAVRFISFEPLLEEITIPWENREGRKECLLSGCVDWVIIGGRSRNSQLSEFQPEWFWVENILNAARSSNCNVYFKPNLTVRPKEYPEQRG